MNWINYTHTHTHLHTQIQKLIPNLNNDEKKKKHIFWCVIREFVEIKEETFKCHVIAKQKNRWLHSLSFPVTVLIFFPLFMFIFLVCKQRNHKHKNPVDMKELFYPDKEKRFFHFWEKLFFNVKNEKQKKESFFKVLKSLLLNRFCDEWEEQEPKKVIWT